MTLYRFTVGYEGTIEAPDPDTARQWALEDVESGRYDAAIVDVDPAVRPMEWWGPIPRKEPDGS